MRGSRIAAIALLWCAGAQAADWTGWWRTPDQRGDRLLRDGDAASAARTYEDPRRKAYAELQGGDYAAAARDYGAFDDGDAHYNRGNALAHSGDLAQALKAYDTALARDPENADARRNRELVAKALERQDRKPQESSSPQGGPNESPRDDASRPSSSDGGRQDGSKGSGEPKSGGTPPPAGEHAGTPQQDASSGHAQENGARPDDAAQARRDVEGSAAQEPSDEKNSASPSSANAAAGGGAQPASPSTQAARAAAQDDEREPPTEAQLAQEQWLRQIPDDPAGLLRRKFMIEHLRRQQNRQP